MSGNWLKKKGDTVPRIAWTPESRTDLREIRGYIRKESPRNADRFLSQLIASTNRLVRHPLLGEVVHVLNRTDIREILCGNYRIFYRAKRDRIDILRVIHAARLLDERMFE